MVLSDYDGLMTITADALRGDEYLSNSEIEEMESAAWDWFLSISYVDPAERDF